MTLPGDPTLTPPTTASAPGAWPPPAVARSAASGPSLTAWTLVTVASIWTAVVLISVLSPDMISGSEHQRLPVAAFGTWIWGFGASIAALVPMVRLRGDVGRRRLGIALSAATTAIWSVATLLSIFGPTMVTGSDPTTIPLAALISPVAAMLGTMAAGTIVLVADCLRHGGRAFVGQFPFVG